MSFFVIVARWWWELVFAALALSSFGVSVARSAFVPAAIRLRHAHRKFPSGRTLTTVVCLQRN